MTVRLSQDIFVRASVCVCPRFYDTPTIQILILLGKWGHECEVGHFNTTSKDWLRVETWFLRIRLAGKVRVKIWS